ncbi:hypothetical protein [Mycolicibacterium houstonense]|uniref:hypothetical protein n=2 Tax=Mycolicibacterium houstonense TaxID=146021 RepID=UPI00093B14F6|nr:hypothetical protein [Mycolicibacterium houstonense]
MTTPSSAHGGGWGQWPHAMCALDHRLTRRQARQMSRRFAGVGVGIGAARLREIASGAPAADAELDDVEFAVVAREFVHDERLAKIKHGKQLCVTWFIVTVMGLAMFGLLLGATVLMLSLMSHTSPF